MIHWNADPELIRVGVFSVRWYGLLFASGFVIGLKVLEKVFDKDRVSQEILDRLFVYMVIGTIVGARLGHCLFYEPEIYLEDPIRIFKVWEGGLASHGGALGIFLVLYIFSRRHQLSWLWLTDRIAIVAALAGGFIRLGNFFNSEIIGRPLQAPWAIIFSRVDQVPRHPTQIYESVTYFSTFGLLYWLYWSRNKGGASGYLTGVFLIFVFGSRFFWEFLKENQVSFEASLPMNMGQMLSIPLVLIGAWLIYRSNSSADSK